jgi:PAS domain S-box-containing protein
MPEPPAELAHQLAASQEIFRLLVDAVNDYAIFMIDPAGTVMTWNEGACRIHGYRPDEIIGQHFSKFYPDDAVAKGQPDNELHVARMEGRYEEEAWRVRKDGTQIWTNVVISPVKDPNTGNLLGYAKVTRDLTERKVASQNEQIFRLMVGSVKDYAIFMLDPNGNVLTWNEGAQRIKGYTSDEIVGRHFSNFYPQEARDKRHPDHELEIAREHGRYEEEGWRVRKDGSEFWANVVITAIHDYNGDLIGFAKVTRDLTERKESMQREQIFRLLVNSVADYAIFMLSPDGIVMTWNEGAERINGYTADDIIGKHFSTFYTKEAQKRKHPQKELEIAALEGRYQEEGWRLRKDGSLIWANVVITAMYQDDKLIGFAKVTRDLTQRLLSDQEREMSARLLDETNIELERALEVKSRFLSTISHEVRTPMSGIIGMTEMLTMVDLGPDNNEIVQSIFVSSKRLLQLLNNLLDSARLEAGELSLESIRFPLKSVVSDIRQLVSADASKKGLRITGTIEPTIPDYVYGDELKLRQVLLNLAHNAVKFTEKGHVDISAQLGAQAQDRVEIRFSVTDTGIGIPPHHREKLFEPFIQAEDSTKRVYGGSGLGLSISKNLVEIMGGTIGCISEHGKGSTFWCQIPFSLTVPRK